MDIEEAGRHINQVYKVKEKMLQSYAKHPEALREAKFNHHNDSVDVFLNALAKDIAHPTKRLNIARAAQQLKIPVSAKVGGPTRPRLASVIRGMKEPAVCSCQTIQCDACIKYEQAVAAMNQLNIKN